MTSKIARHVVWLCFLFVTKTRRARLLAIVSCFRPPSSLPFLPPSHLSLPQARPFSRPLPSLFPHACAATRPANTRATTNRLAHRLSTPNSRVALHSRRRRHRHYHRHRHHPHLALRVHSHLRLLANPRWFASHLRRRPRRLPVCTRTLFSTAD